MLTGFEQALVDSVIRDDKAMDGCATPEATIWRNRAVQLAEIIACQQQDKEVYDTLLDSMARKRRHDAMVSTDGKWIPDGMTVREARDADG